MRFTPCQDQCTSEGSFCTGCGRSFQEINDTKQLASSIAHFIKQQAYENPEDFIAALTKSVHKRLAKD